jgi:hypothetical protein
MKANKCFNARPQYHANITIKCDARLTHGLPDHERTCTRTRHFSFTISQHNLRCSDARCDDNGVRKSVHLFIIRSILQGQKSQKQAARRGIPWMFGKHPPWPRGHSRDFTYPTTTTPPCNTAGTDVDSDVVTTPNPTKPL